MAEVTDYEQVARAEIEEVNRDAGNNPVKVGILTPLTGPGDPVAGFLVARGARLGAEYVRENGGAIINDAVTRQVVDDARAVLGRTTRLR